jgi:hypothetical protein
VQHSKMTCREFVGLIPAFRDGELSETDRESFAHHGWNCRRCSAYLRGYELTVRATKRIAADTRGTNETTIPKSLASRILSDKRKKSGS